MLDLDKTLEDGAVVAQRPDTSKVDGSNPSLPTAERIAGELRKKGYDTIITLFPRECCGDFYAVDYEYGINSEYGFRIAVKPEKIEITRLFFRRIIISFAEFDTVEDLIRTITHCEEVDKED